MPERSVIAFEHAREAAQRFEYFILGVSVALCGYIGQTLKPQRLGLNSQALEIASLLLLIASIVIGFIRLDQGVRIMKMNQNLLDLAEKRRKLIDRLDGKPLRDAATGDPIPAEEAQATIPAYTKAIEAQQAKINTVTATQIAQFWWRNYLLGTAFLSLMAAKILGAYFP